MVHNNRAYFNEIMALQRVANRRNRGIDRTRIGTVLTEPFIDYAALAKSMGMFGVGPITDPKDLQQGLPAGSRHGQKRATGISGCRCTRALRATG